MTTPIDVTEINSVEDTKKAIKTGEITEEKARFIAETFLEIKGDKIESKEKAEDTPELDKENFRIDSRDRKEKTSPNGVKVKENPEGDIREYVEGDYKGEQLFTDTSARREANKTGKKLPASWTIYRDIINKKYEGNYQEFLKGEKIIFAGLRSPHSKRFDGIVKVFGLRCADDSNFYGNRDERHTSTGRMAYGFSVRCLQD